MSAKTLIKLANESNMVEFEKEFNEIMEGLAEEAVGEAFDSFFEGKEKEVEIEPDVENSEDDEDEDEEE